MKILLQKGDFLLNWASFALDKSVFCHAVWYVYGQKTLILAKLCGKYSIK